MKLLSKLISIYFSSLLIQVVSADNEEYEKYAEEEHNCLHECYSFHNLDSINNSTNYNSNDSITNITNAVRYFAPSYFTLIIREIIPHQDFSKFFNESTCLRKYFKEQNDTKIKDLVKYSAKSFPDFGDEEGCISKNKNNVFFLFTIDYYNANSSNYTGNFKLLTFISKGYSFFGLCVENTTDCTIDLETKILNDLNGKGINGLSQSKVKSFHRFNIIQQNREKDLLTIIIYTILFGLYLAVRVVVWIIGYYFFKEKDDISKKKDDDDSSSDEEEEEEDEEDQTNSNSNSQTSSNEVSNDKNNDLISKKDKIVQTPKKNIYPKFYYFYKICSFSQGFKYLVATEENLLFNEKDLYLIIFFRFLAILLKVFYSNFNFFIHNPSKEINNTNVFKNNIMALIKLSSFSDIMIILTESIIVSYKLMSFIRKYADKSQGPSFGLFFNYFIRIIPSMASIIVNFFVYYFNYIIIIAPFQFIGIDIYTTRIQHMKDNLLSCYSCLKDIKSLIPFSLHYNNFSFSTNTNESCFHFMILFINMFYCYCLCMILTFIAFKIKNKIYDIIISILFIIYFVIPNNLFCDSLEYFNINIMLGETCSLSKTHLFINYYMFGFLIGFALFYNNDITTENSLQNSDIYKPFYYLKDIIGFFFKLATWIHILIIILSVGTIFVLSITFIFHTSFNFIENCKEVNLNYFDHFLYLNEKSIYTVVFCILLIILYTFKTESNIKEFGNNIFIIYFHRIGYDFYCFIEIMIYLIYSILGLNYSLTGQNLSFITVGIIFYIMIYSTISNLLVYIPVKLCLSTFLHQNSANKV